MSLHLPLLSYVITFNKDASFDVSSILSYPVVSIRREGIPWWVTQNAQILRVCHKEQARLCFEINVYLLFCFMTTCDGHRLVRPRDFRDIDTTALGWEGFFFQNLQINSSYLHTYMRSQKACSCLNCCSNVVKWRWLGCQVAHRPNVIANALIPKNSYKINQSQNHIVNSDNMLKLQMRNTNDL